MAGLFSWIMGLAGPLFSQVMVLVGPSGVGSVSTAEQVTDHIDASNLTTIITGGGSGIGAESARVFALKRSPCHSCCAKYECCKFCKACHAISFPLSVNVILISYGTKRVDAGWQQWKKTLEESVNEMSSKHVVDMDSLIRTAVESNEQHDAEVASARIMAEEDVARNNKDIQNHFESILEQEKECTNGALAGIEEHNASLRQLQEDHMSQALDIKRNCKKTFQSSYMDYESRGDTPLRSELDVPSKCTIESLREMPINALLKEFRKNNPSDSQLRAMPSRRPRSPRIASGFSLYLPTPPSFP